jgi:hypothetical protein
MINCPYHSHRSGKSDLPRSPLTARCRPTRLSGLLDCAMIKAYHTQANAILNWLNFIGGIEVPQGMNLKARSPWSTGVEVKIVPRRSRGGIFSLSHQPRWHKGRRCRKSPCVISQCMQAKGHERKRDAYGRGVSRAKGTKTES